MSSNEARNILHCHSCIIMKFLLFPSFSYAKQGEDGKPGAHGRDGKPGKEVCYFMHII